MARTLGPQAWKYGNTSPLLHLGYGKVPHVTAPRGAVSGKTGQNCTPGGIRTGVL